MKIIDCTVDEHGRCYGFQPVDGEAGSFGESLEVGQEVETDDGDTGYVSKVYGYIQTGGSGTSNYVAVDIRVDDGNE